MRSARFGLVHFLCLVSSVPTLVEQKQLVIGSEVFVTDSDLCK
jgi:hypothetical protein